MSIDRYVPLPEATLNILRSYWKLHRNPAWIFPRLGHSGKEGPTAQIPMNKGSVQSALRRILKQLKMKKAALLSAIPADVWSIDWNVNCQPAGSSRHSVRYLAPYVFKVAISNRRIIKLKNRNSNRWRIISLDVMEFLRRFLQHALPTGFMKVRYYGFLNPASSVPLNKIRTLIELAYGFEITCRKPALALDPPPICPHCGGKLIYLYSVLPFMMVPARPG